MDETTGWTHFSTSIWNGELVPNTKIWRYFSSSNGSSVWFQISRNMWNWLALNQCTEKVSKAKWLGSLCNTGEVGDKCREDLGILDLSHLRGWQMVDWANLFFSSESSTTERCGIFAVTYGFGSLYLPYHLLPSSTSLKNDLCTHMATQTNVDLDRMNKRCKKWLNQIL